MIQALTHTTPNSIYIRDMQHNWCPKTYKLGQNIISIEKEEKDLRVVIQDNLSSEKHIDQIFGDTLKMCRFFRIETNRYLLPLH